MFTRKYSFLSVGLHLVIVATFLSRSRHFFSLLLTDVVIGLLLNFAHYMPFMLPDAPHRTNYSQSKAIQKNYSLLLKISFPKGYQEIKKSFNQLFMSIRGMGLRRSSEPKGSCMKRITKHIMDFLYRFLSFNFSNH